MVNKILMTIGIIIGLFLIGLISDVIRVNLVKTKAEKCLEEVIRKGAVLIDTPQAVKKRIKQEAKVYQLYLSDMEINISPHRNKITITKSLLIKPYFAWLLGKKTLKLHLQKQVDILRQIQPITELETIPLGIIRPNGLNFGFLYKLAKEPETTLLEEKLVGLDFESEFSKTLKVGNIIKMRQLKEGELEGLIRVFIDSCKNGCRINNFSPKCPKLLKIAVVEPFEPIPSMVKVVGFACFFVEEADDERIRGYFVEHYQHGISDVKVSSDFGLRTRSKVEIVSTN